MDKLDCIMFKELFREYIKNQSKIGRKIATLSIFVGLYAIVTDKIIREHNKQIEELGNEVKELKRMRGE